MYKRQAIVSSDTDDIFDIALLIASLEILTSLTLSFTCLLYTSTLFENYDIEIIEKHHNQKVDAPSGTALLLGDTIREAVKAETEYVFGRSGNDCKRQKKEIGVHAIRGG